MAYYVGVCLSKFYIATYASFAVN